MIAAIIHVYKQTKKLYLHKMSFIILNSVMWLT